MAQDYYDILQPFDYLVDLLDDNKAVLGIKYIAQHNEELPTEYPALLVQTDNELREFRATQLFMVRWFMDIWVFHASLTEGIAERSRTDIELATAVRKLIHTKRDMDGHIVQGWIAGSIPGVANTVVGGQSATIVTTRLMWQGENRVRFQDS